MWTVLPKSGRRKITTRSNITFLCFYSESTEYTRLDAAYAPSLVCKSIPRSNLRSLLSTPFSDHQFLDLLIR